MINLFTASLRIISTLLKRTPRKKKAMATQPTDQSFEERDHFTIDTCPDPHSLMAMYMIAAQRSQADAAGKPFVAGFVGAHGEKYVAANELAPPAALAHVDANLDMQKLEIVEMQKLLKYVEMRQKKAEDYRKMC